jgi:putative protease
MECKRSFSITNLKYVALFVDKSKDCFHRIYNEHNFLNTGIVTDLQSSFSSFFIDLKVVRTATKVEMNEIRINKIFEDLLNEKPDAREELERAIYPSWKFQYKRSL